MPKGITSKDELSKAILALPAVKAAVKDGKPVLVFFVAGCPRCEAVEKIIVPYGKTVYVKVDVSKTTKAMCGLVNKDNAPLVALVIKGQVVEFIAGPNPQNFTGLDKELKKRIEQP